MIDQFIEFEYEDEIENIGYLIVSELFIRATDNISDGALKTYLLLRCYARGTKKNCFPSITLLAKERNCSEQTIRNHLMELEKNNIVKIKRREGKTSLITLLSPLNLLEKYKEKMMDSSSSFTPQENLTPQNILTPQENLGNPSRKFDPPPQENLRGISTIEVLQKKTTTTDDRDSACVQSNKKPDDFSGSSCLEHLIDFPEQSDFLIKCHECRLDVSLHILGMVKFVLASAENIGRRQEMLNMFYKSMEIADLSGKNWTYIGLRKEFPPKHGILKNLWNGNGDDINKEEDEKDGIIECGEKCKYHSYCKSRGYVLSESGYKSYMPCKKGEEVKLLEEKRKEKKNEPSHAIS